MTMSNTNDAVPDRDSFVVDPDTTGYVVAHGGTAITVQAGTDAAGIRGVRLTFTSPETGTGYLMLASVEGVDLGDALRAAGLTAGGQ